jgi:hypothetical protein
MKTLRLLLLSVVLASSPALFVACSTPPNERVVQVQTLKAVGHTAESAVAASAQFYAAGRITAAQARQVMDIYDKRFQPAFRVAVNAVNANLDSVASPELVAIAAELSALVLTFQNK